MKLVPSLFKTALRLLVFPLGLLLCQNLSAAVGFAISPATVSNTYVGTISLVVTGLTGGETVVVQKFLDANTNNTIDAPDLLVQQFRLTDGQASFIGGVTNINVPGDTDSTAGQVTAQLIFQTDDFIQKISGKYAFKLSSPSGTFTPLTNSFSVTEFPYSQTITGSVVNSGTNVPNASVILFPPPRPGHGPGTPLGGTVANNSGNYSMKVAAGVYSLMAFKSNYLVNAGTAPLITVGSGATVITNLVITNAAAQIISGKIADAANNSIGLPGLGLHGSAGGLLAFAFSDTNGDFTMPVRSGQWGLGSEGLSLLGYVQNDGDGVSVDTTAGSTNGVIVPFSKANACLYGSVKDNQNHPLAGVHIFSSDNTYQYAHDVYTDPNGNYVAYALGGGTWQVMVDDNNNASFANYVFSQGLNQNGGTNINVGQAVPYNFTAILATNHITGHIQFNSAPVSGVQVFAYANIGGVDYQTQVNTDASGNYSLNVANGSWGVGVSCDGGDESLEGILGSGNFQCPDNQNVVISSADGTANITILPCGTVQITTASLPTGTVGDFYQTTLAASSCQQTFNWSLSPGSPGLPAGLGLSSGGTLSGFPDTAGSNYFSLRVTDGGNHTNDKAFSLIINAGSSPLQVTTTTLPDGTLDTFYSQSVNASGGQPPYHWYLPGGTITLPPGTMGLSDDGILSGTPTAAGTYNFWVGVWDDTSSVVATQYLSLTINASSSPPNNGAWTYKPFMPTERSDPAAVTIDGILFVVGGNTHQGFSGVLEAFNPLKGTWTTLAPMPTVRAGLAGGVINGKIYAAGGIAYLNVLGQLEVYDPVANSWTNGHAMNVARVGAAAGVIGGKLYIVGGTSDFTRTLEVYDPVTDTWTIKASMPTPRSALAAGVINGKLYAVGGYNSVTGIPNGLDTVEVYDPATDSWSAKASMPTARYGLAVAVLNGRLYAVGGSATGRELEVYDAIANSWSTAAPMLTARSGLAAAFVGDRLFAVGGGGNPVPFVEQYGSNDTSVVIILKSGAATLAAGLGSGAPTVAMLNRLDAGDTSGLTFQSAQVGAFGSGVSMPSGAPTNTVVVNIPTGNGQNGFFKMTFVLPAGFSGCQLSCGANIDYYGRVFLNSNAISPSLTDSARITSSSDRQYSTTDPTFFHVGTNEVVFADANADGGGSGGAFYCLVTYRVSAALNNPAKISGNQFQFTLTGEPGAMYRIEANTNLANPSGWTILGTNTASGGSFLFVDSATSGFTTRFYRAVQVQ